MKMKQLFFGICALTLFSCGDKKQEVKTEDAIVIDTVVKPAETADKMDKTPIDSTETKLKKFMIKDFVKADIKFISEADHQFQYENIDLNNDNVPETFVRFSSPYYCGSGGCTFLLLDNQQKIITKFTVMEAPIFVEKVTKQGWAVLLVKDRGVFKELLFDGKKYPSNPSVLPKAPYDAPSGHANILFDKPFAEGEISVF